MLSNEEFAGCRELRKALHQIAELSNCEHATSEKIVDSFATLRPDNIIRDLGGTGVAICFGSRSSGPVVMLRCELDALPIEESISVAHGSLCDRVSHKCGHDGHMAILHAVAMYFAKNRPENGRVILLFQPAEETGEGARRILEDPKFREIEPHYVFSLHNVPGFKMGNVLLKPGTFCCASRGAAITLVGRTAHAAQPETGISPVGAVTELLLALNELPKYLTEGSNLTFATIVGVKIGDKAFGTAPKKGEVCVTLRSESDLGMEQLINYVSVCVEEAATKYGLSYSIEFEDVFEATVNSKVALALVTDALCNEPIIELKQPMRWSEDFGLFSQRYCGLMFGLGAGENTPALHDAQYDFPDELIEHGSRYFIKIVQRCLQLPV